MSRFAPLSKIQKNITENILVMQNDLVEACLDKDIFSWDDVENLNETSAIIDLRGKIDHLESLIDAEGEKDKWLDGLDDLIEELNEEEQKFKQKDIMQWWVVTDWFAERLRDLGESVIENDYGTWWGRATAMNMHEQSAVIQITLDHYV